MHEAVNIDHCAL